MQLRKFGVANPDEYWKTRYAENRAGEKRVHRVIRGLCDELQPTGGTVLDCGVGDGHEFRLCQQKHDTYGVEWSSEAIARYDFPTDTIQQADLNDGIPEFNKKFDVVIMSMVLHWLDDPLNFLKGTIDHLSQVGKILVVTPNTTHFKYRVRYLFGEFPKISASHKSFLTPKEYESLFENAGYHIDKKTATKKSWKTKLFPRLFATDLVYILSPRRKATG